MRLQVKACQSRALARRSAPISETGMSEAEAGQGRTHSLRAETAEMLGLAGPVIAARLGIMAMGLVDALVVGRFSAKELAYHALGWAPTAVIVTTAVGLMIGVQVMTARAIGEGRRNETGAVLRRGIVYAFWLGLGSTVLLFSFGPMIMTSIGLDRELAEGSAKALRIFSLSLTPYLVSVAATFYVEALSRPGPGVWAMWLANIVNLGLALLLVPGAFGIPAMGAVGAGWATLGARTALMGMLLFYIWRMMPDARELGVFDKPRPNPAEAAEQRKIGYGAGASYFVETAAFLGMNFLTGYIGTMAVAAWAVVLNVSAVVFMAPLGLSAAAAVLVGRAFGARDRRGVIRAGWTAIGLALAFGVVISLVVWAFARPISSAYTTDPALLAMVVPAMVLACLFFAADCIQVVAAQALRARDDIWVPTGTHVFSYAIVMVPLAWWLAIPLKQGLIGVMWACIVASLLAAGFLAGRFWMLGSKALPPSPEGAPAQP